MDKTQLLARMAAVRQAVADEFDVNGKVAPQAWLYTATGRMVYVPLNGPGVLSTKLQVLFAQLGPFGANFAGFTCCSETYASVIPGREVPEGTVTDQDRRTRRLRDLANMPADRLEALKAKNRKEVLMFTAALADGDVGIHSREIVRQTVKPALGPEQVYWSHSDHALLSDGELGFYHTRRQHATRILGRAADDLYGANRSNMLTVPSHIVLVACATLMPAAAYDGFVEVLAGLGKDWYNNTVDETMLTA